MDPRGSNSKTLLPLPLLALIFACIAAGGDSLSPSNQQAIEFKAAPMAVVEELDFEEPAAPLPAEIPDPKTEVRDNSLCNAFHHPPSSLKPLRKISLSYLPKVNK